MIRRWTKRAHAMLTSTRRRWALVDVVVDTADGYRFNRLNQVSAMLTYYSFWSIFPLLLSFTAVLGFVLQDNPDLQESIVDSTLARVPIIGQQLEVDAASLQGSGPVFVIALLTATWAGLKVFVIANLAIDDIDGIPRHERMAFVHRRLRALITIVVIGTALVVSAVVSALLRASHWAMAAQIALLALTLAFNAGLIGITYRLLASVPRRWRDLWPGALLAGLAYFVLQVVGVLVVGRAITRATPVYGTFATVIGLMTWILVHSVVALAGYQLNVVLARRRTPPAPTDRL